MPYAKDFNRPKRDDVLWGNDSLLPTSKQFDTSHPPDDLICNLGEDSHQVVSSGYLYDPDIGWLLACYDHIMEKLDSDATFKPGAPVAEVSTTRQRLEQEKRVVPEGALCDNPHDELPDSPPAAVGVFKTRQGAKDATRFLCTTCAIVYVHKALVIDAGEFEPFELVPAGRKKQ